jgi:GTP-binding protein
MSNKLPTIAIIGRPNVGKSTLFNRVIGRRHALVDNQPGVTRDRHYDRGEWNGHYFILIDTGGVEASGNQLTKAVLQQTRQAISEADCLWLVMDGRSGATVVDADVLNIARKSGKSVFYVLNKMDTESVTEMSLPDFHEAGFELMYPVSAEHGRGVDALLDASIQLLYKSEFHPQHPWENEVAGIRVAIVGRPNVGKSTLTNALFGAERMVTHDLAGTTRDAIDVRIHSKGEDFIFVDTPGIKRRAKTETKLEKFSAIKALQAAERADVVLLVMDGSEGVTHQDLQLAKLVLKKHRPLAVLVNKWDCIADKKLTPAKYNDYLEDQFQEMRDLPSHHISAKTGEGVSGVWALIKRINRAAGQEISTARLNKLLQHLQAHHHLPAFRDHHVKLNYITQTGVRPPRFVIFTNFPQGIPLAYRRYLARGLQEELGMPGLPIQILFRRK